MNLHHHHIDHDHRLHLSFADLVSPKLTREEVDESCECGGGIFCHYMKSRLVSLVLISGVCTKRGTVFGFSSTTARRRTRSFVDSSALSPSVSIRVSSSARSMSSSSGSETGFPSVADFLQQISLLVKDPYPRLAIGNPAGDADSIISAIGAAYVDTTLRQKPTLPIVSIPLQDLKTLRPETKYLLSLGGIQDLDRLIAVDNPSLPQEAIVTLVDHNQLMLSREGWTVGEILDHHMDQGAHMDTCQGEDRRVAFDVTSSMALVASTCTIVVEQWRNYAPTSLTGGPVNFPPTLSILLLGVILLDSINLSVKAGKGTERDQWAVETLHRHTDWKALALPADICSDGKVGGTPDNTKLFDTLQNQKFQPEFWNGLTALQALQLDYKSFMVERQGSTTLVTFGVSSILQSMPEFLQKPGICKSLAEHYFPQLEFFGIMFMTVVDDVPQRQMMMISPDESLLQSLVEFFVQEGSLQLARIEWGRDAETKLWTVTMEQGNAKASRKQVVPIFMDFFQKRMMGNGKL